MQTPPAWKTKAIRLAANQCALMARVDNFGEDPSGAKGKVTLEEMKQKILTYVQSRMTFIAPNLTVIVGASTAAKLMGMMCCFLRSFRLLLT